MNISRAAPGSVCDSGPPGASAKSAAWIVDVEPAHFENARCLLVPGSQLNSFSLSLSLWERVGVRAYEYLILLVFLSYTLTLPSPKGRGKTDNCAIHHHHTIDNQPPALSECKCSWCLPATAAGARSCYPPCVDSETYSRPTARPGFHCG